MNKDELRPIEYVVNDTNGEYLCKKRVKGWFHRYVSERGDHYETAYALIETSNGQLIKYDDFDNIIFLDRQGGNQCTQQHSNY